MKHSTSPYEIILFDIGGVLGEFKGSMHLIELVEGETTEDKIRAFHRVTRPWVRMLESGACSIEKFARGHLEDWPTGLTPEALIEELESWPLKLYPGAIELLNSLQDRHTLGCLTNTNPIHWPLQRDGMGLGGYFLRQYVSYEVGHLKPDPAVYEHVIDDLACEPGRILFLDDRGENVEAAIAVGIQAMQVKGIDETRSALDSLNLLDS